MSSHFPDTPSTGDEFRLPLQYPQAAPRSPNGAREEEHIQRPVTVAFGIAEAEAEEAARSTQAALMDCYNR